MQIIDLPLNFSQIIAIYWLYHFIEEWNYNNIANTFWEFPHDDSIKLRTTIIKQSYLNAVFHSSNTSIFLCVYLFHKYNKFPLDDNNESYQTKIKRKKEKKKVFLHTYTLRDRSGSMKLFERKIPFLQFIFIL